MTALSDTRSWPDTGESFWTEYGRQTRRPLTSLAFLLPLLMLYEAGVLWSTWKAPSGGIAGAHAWMIMGLEWLGYGGLYLPPVVIVVVLLGWHVVEGRPWTVRYSVVACMLMESLVMALVLVAVLYGVLGLMGRQPVAASATTLSNLLLYLGAGIYEETLFRLLLLPLIYGVGLALSLPKPVAAAGAVAASAVAFAAAHHVGAQGQAWAADSFVFRSVAGALFAGMFVARGFGVTVGAHAIYDMLVG